MQALHLAGLVPSMLEGSKNVLVGQAALAGDYLCGVVVLIHNKIVLSLRPAYSCGGFHIQNAVDIWSAISPMSLSNQVAGANASASAKSAGRLVGGVEFRAFVAFRYQGSSGGFHEVGPANSAKALLCPPFSISVSPSRAFGFVDGLSNLVYSSLAQGVRLWRPCRRTSSGKCPPPTLKPGWHLLFSACSRAWKASHRQPSPGDRAGWQEPGPPPGSAGGLGKVQLSQFHLMLGAGSSRGRRAPLTLFFSGLNSPPPLPGQAEPCFQLALGPGHQGVSGQRSGGNIVFAGLEDGRAHRLRCGISSRRPAAQGINFHLRVVSGIDGHAGAVLQVKSRP